MKTEDEKASDEMKKTEKQEKKWLLVEARTTVFP